jgi:hypothetical protein
MDGPLDIPIILPSPQRQGDFRQPFRLRSTPEGLWFFLRCSPFYEPTMSQRR